LHACYAPWPVLRDVTDAHGTITTQVYCPRHGACHALLRVQQAPNVLSLTGMRHSKHRPSRPWSETAVARGSYQHSVCALPESRSFCLIHKWFIISSAYGSTDNDRKSNLRVTSQRAVVGNFKPLPVPNLAMSIHEQTPARPPLMGPVITDALTSQVPTQCLHYEPCEGTDSASALGRTSFKGRS